MIIIKKDYNENCWLLTSVGLLFHGWHWWMSFFLFFFLAKPFDPTFFLSCTVSNVICCLVFGQRFSYDDKHFLYLLQIISDTLKFGSSSQGQVKAKVTITWNWHGGWVIQLKTKCAQIIARVQQHCNTAIESFFFFLSSQLYNIFPRLMEWLPGSHHNVFAKLEEMRAFIMNKIQERQDTLDASSPRDYIDCFLLRLNKVWQN